MPFSGTPSSEPCVPLVAAHSSSSPLGRAGICCAGPCCAVRRLVSSGAVGVYEAVCRPAAVMFGDGLAGHRLSDGRVPGFPLVEGVWWAVDVQQRFSAQRALSVLVTQGVLPGRGQLWGFALVSPVGPVLGQGRVVG